MKSYFSVIFLGLLFLLSCQKKYPPAHNISLNPLFTDNMVLQQKLEIPIWGTATPGSRVDISFKSQQKEAVAGEKGHWMVKLSPEEAGGPFKLSVRGENAVTIHNVMVGEVWLCSGQSNMEMAVGGNGKVKNYKEEIAHANYPQIRLFKVDKVMAHTPQNGLKGSGWQVCSPETIPEFSAVAYFFGRDLNRQLNVPVGLIESAWGGTVVEAWTSGKTLKEFPGFRKAVETIEADKRTEAEKTRDFKKEQKVWPDKIEEILKASGTLDHGYQNPVYGAGTWKTMNLPGIWEDKGLQNTDGVVWFRKDVALPRGWAGKDLTLSLGKINDYDLTWFNGQRVGRGTDVADYRVYKIPGDIVKAGKGIITVEVLDIGNVGGLYGPAKDMKLVNGDQSIDLTGEWKYKVDPVKINVGELPEKPDQNAGVNRPTVLFNGMIHPLLPYGIRGVIWYQGESNAPRAYQYRQLFPAMIRDWRSWWKEGDFPFLFVQLANFMSVKPESEDDAWAELREAQTMALKLPHTGMAVTIDIGEAKNIHPKNKQEVGRRLALNALALVYDKDIPFSGPLYQSMKTEGTKIRIRFTHTDGGLKIKNGKELNGFAIAGKDKKFVWAEGRIDGDDVVIWSPEVKNPVAVRYAWAANPVCNLYNGAGLPASPFRTDNWKGITYGKE